MVAGVCVGVTGACVGATVVAAGVCVGITVVAAGVCVVGTGVALAAGVGAGEYAVPLPVGAGVVAPPPLLMTLHASFRLSSSFLTTMPLPTVQSVKSKFLLPMSVETTLTQALEWQILSISAGVEPCLTLARSTLPDSAALKLFCLTHSMSSLFTSRPLNATTSTSLAHAAARTDVAGTTSAVEAARSSSGRRIAVCVWCSRARNTLEVLCRQWWLARRERRRARARVESGMGRASARVPGRRDSHASSIHL